MSPEQFVYWMQGYTELTNGAMPTAEQWAAICDHLKQVFHKVTPSRISQDQIKDIVDSNRNPDPWDQSTLIC